MNKKTFAASLDFSKSTFERRSVQIDCLLPGGLLSEDMRNVWLEKLHKWERQQMENKQKIRGEAK